MEFFKQNPENLGIL